MNGIAWYALFGEGVGIVEWIYLGVLGLLAFVAWAVRVAEDETPTPPIALARLAAPITAGEWTAWERL